MAWGRQVSPDHAPFIGVTNPVGEQLSVEVLGHWPHGELYSVSCGVWLLDGDVVGVIRTDDPKWSETAKRFFFE